MTKNNWFKTSLSDRSKNNLCDFTITVNPHTFNFDSFENNSNRVVLEIANKYEKLYLLYSGGILSLINGFYQSQDFNRQRILWNNGINYLASIIPEYIVYKDGIPDKMKVFTHTYQIGKMKDEY
jgi:hypothetical protein